jgi:predicted dithiol-disulfide oxidoreductase (DUF899 family)
MTSRTVPHPPIVSRDQWLAERKKLLTDEKELTKHYDRINAERRRLPMVKIEKARGTESLTNTYTLLDTTPYGRQQEFEDSPAGWPQKPTYGMSK